MTRNRRFSSSLALVVLAAAWVGGLWLLDRLALRPRAALLLAGGMGIVLILGAVVLLTNPISRLLERVRRVEAGDYVPEHFTRDLHAEPLALANRLKNVFGKMISLSATDGLTGLPNRRCFDEALQRAYLEARRYHRRLSVLMMDVDLFKVVNDTAGHPAGDALLKGIAGVLRQCCRRVDLPARLGGDEFAVLLPETSAAAAAVVAGRVRQAVGGRTFALGGSEAKVTLSVGIADLNTDRMDSAEDLLGLADRALQAAKTLGRNRHVQAHELKGIGEDGREGERSERIRERLLGLDRQFKGLFLRSLEEIVRVLEQRDPYMAGHARKVRHYSALTAKAMGLPEQAIKRVEFAAMLADVGMLTLPASVLVHAGRLTPEQRQAVQKHPLAGARILEGMEFLEQVVASVRSHHERYDGSGYPDGLAGPSIPLPARIVAVADAFAAMTSPRSFRSARTREEALAEIQSAAGAQFDRAVVAAFAAELARERSEPAPPASPPPESEKEEVVAART